MPPSRLIAGGHSYVICVSEPWIPSPLLLSICNLYVTTSGSTACHCDPKRWPELKQGIHSVPVAFKGQLLLVVAEIIASIARDRGHVHNSTRLEDIDLGTIIWFTFEVSPSWPAIHS